MHGKVIDYDASLYACWQVAPSIAVKSPLNHAKVDAAGQISLPSQTYWDPNSSKLADVVEEACSMVSSNALRSTFALNVPFVAILLAASMTRSRPLCTAQSCCTHRGRCGRLHETSCNDAVKASHDA